MSDAIRPLPGARDLLLWLTSVGIRWAIATSGRMETASVNLKALGVDPERVPVVTRDQVKYAKPDPDLFIAAAERLDAPIETAVVVGDSIWDMLAAARCRALGVGLLCGGYGEEELQKATACQGLRGPGGPASAHRRARRAAVRPLAIPGRGFHLFNGLRRHLRATVTAKLGAGFPHDLVLRSPRSGRLEGRSSWRFCW